jgi:hypothetical protein
VRAMTRAEAVRAVKRARFVFVVTALTAGKAEHFRVTKAEALFRLGHLADVYGEVRCEVNEAARSVTLGGRAGS